MPSFMSDFSIMLSSYLLDPNHGFLNSRKIMCRTSERNFIRGYKVYFGSLPKGGGAKQSGRGWEWGWVARTGTGGAKQGSGRVGE